MNTKDIAITPVQQMISSCTGAIMTSLLVTPLDVVKIRLQAQQKEFVKHKCFLYCNGLMEHICYCPSGNGNGNASTAAALTKQWYQRPGHFSGTLDAFVKITRHEGMTSLWSGLPPTLVMAVPATMVYFTLYDQLRVALNRALKVSKQPDYVPALAGGLARILAATVISPLEMIRTKMQAKKLSYTELRAAVQSQVKSQGMVSLWRGLGPTLLRDVPFSVIYWTSYENLKKQFGQQEKPKWICSFAFGALSGCIAALVTAPFDVIKTHRQIEVGEMEVLKVPPKVGTTGTFSLIAKLYRSSGFTALYAGTVPRLIKIAPACAIMISTYEFGKTFFSKYNASRNVS